MASVEFDHWNALDSEDHALTYNDYAARQIGATFALTAAVYEVAIRLQKILELNSK